MARGPNLGGDVSLLYSFAPLIFIVLVFLANLNTFISHASVVETLAQRPEITGEFNV